MIHRQSLGVALGLALRLHHRLCPSRRATPRGAALHAHRSGLAEQVEIVLATLGCGPVGIAALLRLKDESAALV